MVRQGAVIPAWGQAVSGTRSTTWGAGCAAVPISAPATRAALAETSLARWPSPIARYRRPSARWNSAAHSSAIQRPSERNLVIEIAALAAGAGHGRLARRARTGGAGVAARGFTGREIA